MADVNRGNRPLSPHLTIYRPQMTSMSSILIRITGISLLAGSLLVVAWFLSAAMGPAAFDCVNAIMTSWFGKIVMIGSLWALWYHSLGGLRHLIWDQVVGLEIKTAERLGWAVIIGSVVLTVLTLVII